MKEFIVLGGAGILLNLLMVYLLNKGFFLDSWLYQRDVERWLGNRGEAGDGGDNKGGDGGDMKFNAEQQKFIDKLIDKRSNEFKQKYADYDNLKTKVSEFEKQQNEKSQKELEDQKKYEEAKKGLETKLSEKDKIIADRESRINDMTISYELTNEINKQNAYAEETLALVKANATIKDGKVRIKGKDTSGVDIEYSVEEGIKKFLENRPHLIKSNFKAGGGGKGGDGGDNGAGGGKEDINTLNADLAKAMNSGDRKKVMEIKQKINAHYAGRGIALQK